MADMVYKNRFVQESIDDSIRHLATFVSRMERRYECGSSVMERDVREGRYRETAEVGRWLAKYHDLCGLVERA